MCIFFVRAGDKFSTAGVEVEHMVDKIFDDTVGIVYNHVGTGDKFSPILN